MINQISNNNSLYGIHERALRLESRRAQLLADNLVNSTTPNYKARDFSVGDALKQGSENHHVELMTDKSGQVSHHTAEDDINIQYRVPMQESLDGNTVESDIEESQFANNSTHYRATLSFIHSRVANVLSALRGE